jgi:hypothetical protein
LQLARGIGAEDAGLAPGGGDLLISRAAASVCCDEPATRWMPSLSPPAVRTISFNASLVRWICPVIEPRRIDVRAAPVAVRVIASCNAVRSLRMPLASAVPLSITAKSTPSVPSASRMTLI